MAHRSRSRFATTALIAAVFLLAGGSAFARRGSEDDGGGGDAKALVLRINSANASGRPITLEPRGATLTVRAPSAPFLLEADGDKVEPGELAELGVNTYEPFLVSGGKITLTWNAKMAGGPPTVRLDPRYGKSTFTTDTSKPGRLVVDFKSSDSSFNTVPVTIVSIAMPIAASASIGSTSPFALDPAGTWLLNRRGRKIPVRLQNGGIEVR